MWIGSRLRISWTLYEAFDTHDADRLVDVALVDPERRLVALSYLGELADTTTVPAIARLLRASDDSARAGAAAALGAIGSELAEAPLLGRLAEEANPGVRYAIIDALGRIRAPSSGAAIRAFLIEPADPEFEAAVIASARLGDRLAVPALKRAVVGLATWSRRRRSIKRAIAAIETERGWPGDRPALLVRGFDGVSVLMVESPWPLNAILQNGPALLIYWQARPLLPTWAWVSLLVGWVALVIAAHVRVDKELVDDDAVPELP